jgi:hypothetical protein
VSRQEMPTVFMVYLSSMGKGRLRSVSGRSLENRLRSVMRCWAVCSAFPGQLHSGVGAFFFLWR